MLFYSLIISDQYVVSVYLGIQMCKDDPFNHIALHFSNYDQYHHQFRWLTFGFPATNDKSHVTCLLFIFECVPHMGRSKQIKYLRLYFNVFYQFQKLNKRVSNITNGLRFCRPLPRKFLFKKCHIYIDTIEWKCIFALASTEQTLMFYELWGQL